MKPVIQQIIHAGNGDCFSACLATILELKLEEVPKFMWHFKGHELKAASLWISQYGYGILRVRWPEQIITGKDIPFHPMPYLYCIAAGKSPRGDWNHAVVGTIEDFTFKLLHDPHPSGLGIVGQPIAYNFLVPTDPSRMQLKKTEEWTPLSFFN